MRPSLVFGVHRFAGVILAGLLLFPDHHAIAQTDPPAITVQPVSLTNPAGTYPKFTVEVTGSQLTYQWYKDDLAIRSSGYSGYTTNALTVSYARKTNDGAFYVIVTNSYGSVTSSTAKLTVQDPAISSHPVSFTAPPHNQFSVTAAGTAPFFYQWHYNGSAIAGATNTYLTTFPNAPVSATNVGIYHMVVSNLYGCVTSSPAMLTINAAIAETLTCGEPNATVYTTAVQSDGSFLIGGAFSTVEYTTRNRIARVLPNGALDLQFNPNANGTVYCILQQNDGKLIVGGSFTTVGGKTCRYLGRLFPNGSLDTNFNVSVSSTIYCLAWGRDGQILAGGVDRLLRFSEAGVVDSTFTPAVSGTIYSIVEQPFTPAAGSGIIIGGSFWNIAGVTRQGLARLWADGRVDTLFNTPVAGKVYALALDGYSTIVAGGFSQVGGLPRTNIARIDLSGNVSQTYNPGAPNGVYSIAVQADGKAVFGGGFTSLAGVPRSGLGRLNADGTIDPTFAPSASSTYAISLEADGKMVVGGDYSLNRLGRLRPTSPVSQELQSTPSTLTWFRSGALPEIDYVVFEQYVFGTGWIKIADGQRIPGGWQAPGTVAPGVTWRARGKASGGYGGGSGSIIEFTTGPIIILSQPTGGIVSGTATVPMSMIACGSGPLSYQWFRNGIALTGETNSSYAALPLAGTYQVVVCNELGCVQSGIIRNWRVSVAETAVRASPNLDVSALALQPDGKILVGGSFTNVQTPDLVKWPRNGLMRLEASGDLDPTFNPNVAGVVLCLAVMPDGKIVLGGDFTSVAGQPRTCLARLNPDGTLDTTFTVNVSAPVLRGVYTLVPVAGGKLLVGGSFTSIGGQPRDYVARLESSGAVDNTFVPPSNLHPNHVVNTIVPQSDGLILLGGHFMRANLYADYMWVTQTGAYAGLGYPTPTPLGGYGVLAALQQPNDKILLGGYGFQVDSQSSRKLARLNADRSLDTNFLAFANGPVTCLAAQADGRILVGGAFTSLNGIDRYCLGRLLPDGSLDPDFNPTVTSTNNVAVLALALQPDGKLLLGGRFTNVLNSTRYNLARLPAWGPATESWSFDGSNLTWLRDGTAPEYQSVTLDSSPDGSNWHSVVSASRIPGGWLMNGLSLPSNQHLRVRGQATDSGTDSSQIGTLLGAPVIKTQPLSITNAIGAVAGLFADVQGPGPFWYQWCQDGIPLSDGGHLTGAHEQLLGFKLQGTDVGNYSVIITNLFGSVTSSNATLTTLDLSTPPRILTDEPAFGIHTNRFTFRIHAVRGQACIVEYSSNLKLWYPLITNVATTSNPITFVDPAGTSIGRYYRVRLR